MTWEEVCEPAPFILQENTKCCINETLGATVSTAFTLSSTV